MYEDLISFSSPPVSRIDTMEISHRHPKRARTLAAGDAEIWAAAHAVVDQLHQNTEFVWFAEPVDTAKLNIPEYDRIIKKKMDLHTIRDKIARGDYEAVDHVADDVRLVVRNAVTFNKLPTHAVHTRALTLQQTFEVMWNADVIPLMGSGVEAQKPKPAPEAEQPTEEPAAPIEAAEEEADVSMGAQEAEEPMTKAKRSQMLTARLSELIERDPDAVESVLGVLGYQDDPDQTYSIDLDECTEETLGRLETYLKQQEDAQV